MAQQKGRIEQIDVLRGIAAILVLLYHYGTRYNQIFPDKQGWMPLNLFWGSYGVHLFFIVSGFVIFMTIENSKSRLDFVVSRVSRLYPVYWAAVLFTVAFDFLDPSLGFHPTSLQIAANLTMLQDFARIPHVDGSYWSLTFELGFYTFMFAAFGSRLLQQPAILALFWSGASAAFHFYPGLFPGGLHFIAVTHQYGHLFAAGLAFYWLHSRGFSRTPHDVTMIGIILVAPLVQYLHSGLTGFWTVLGSVLLVAAATRGLLAWLSNPVTLWLGSISYPLYLIHEHAGWHLLSIQQRHGVPPMIALCVTLGAMLGVAALLSLFIEKPAQRWIRAWYKRLQHRRGLAVRAA